MGRPRSKQRERIAAEAVRASRNATPGGEIGVVPTESGRVRSRAAPCERGAANRVRLRYGRGGEADARGVRGSGFAGDVFDSGWRRSPPRADATKRPPRLLRRTSSRTSRNCLPRARASRAQRRLRPSRLSGRLRGGGDAPGGRGRALALGVDLVVVEVEMRGAAEVQVHGGQRLEGEHRKQEPDDRVTHGKVNDTHHAQNPARRSTNQNAASVPIA